MTDGALRDKSDITFIAVDSSSSRSLKCGASGKWNTGPRSLVPWTLSDKLGLNCNTSNPFVLNATSQSGDGAGKRERLAMSLQCDRP